LPPVYVNNRAWEDLARTRLLGPTMPRSAEGQANQPGSRRDAGQPHC